MEKLYLIKRITHATYSKGKLVEIDDTANSNKIQIKIGRSHDPVKRLKELQTANGDALVILGVYACRDCPALEKKMHTHFEKNRQMGEWFLFNQKELEECIKGVRKYIIEIHKQLNNGNNSITVSVSVSGDSDNVDDADADNTMKFICEHCDYKTNDKSNWNRHLKSAHHSKSTEKTPDIAQPKNFHCVCGKVFKYPSGISRHRKDCNGPIKKECNDIQQKELMDLINKVDNISTLLQKCIGNNFNNN